MHISIDKNKRILVTGGHGLLGHALQKILPPGDNVLYPTHDELDLTITDDVLCYFSKHRRIDYVIHLAAKVGGISFNKQSPAYIYEENIRMDTNVLRACVEHNVSKVLSTLSTCVYPDKKYATYPLTEDQIHLGPPHDGNAEYAYTKRMLEVFSRACRNQYGSNFITAVPNNLFGPHDNFDIETSHVIPGLMRKIWEAKLHSCDYVEIWGSGLPRREFTYSLDAAKILVCLLNEYDDAEPINIGTTTEYTIRHIAEKIALFFEYYGEFTYNSSRPDGIFRKPSTNAKLLQYTSWEKDDYTPFSTALRETCTWFAKAYPNVRGI